MRGKTLLVGMVGIVIGVLLSTAVVFAGSLNPTAGPGSAGSQMYTLQQIWDRINNGAAATKMSAFTEPSTGPGSTMKTLDDLYILAGQRSRPAKTGQTTGYASGDDGDLEKGVAWPNPRFTDNGDGTVTDNLTGLIWLKTANCFSLRTWANALSAANTLNSGECDLTDGSAERAWRLPNVREMQSLIDYSRYNFALPSGHPFTNVENALYWTSTAFPGSSAIVWTMYLVDGGIDPVQNVPTNLYRVWPVRGGQ